MTLIPNARRAARPAALVWLCALWLALAMAPVSAEEAPGSVERGERLAMVCAGCHGPGGKSMIPDIYPSIAGLEASVLAQALEDFRSGERSDPQMSPQAAVLGDQEIEDLAAYFAAQEGE